MIRRPLLIAAALALGAGSFTGCAKKSTHHTHTTTVSTPREATASHQGPPPHAPAHGYRYKAADRDLVYDSRLRLYVVAGTSTVYYEPGRQLYFRLASDGWQLSVQMDDGWKAAAESSVPKSLRTKLAKGKGKGKKKHQVAARD